MSIYVVDVSSNNAHPIDFPSIYAAGIIGVYVKCTEGVTYVNPSYQADISAARAAKLRVGSYHFGRANVDGTAQAAFFAQHAREYAAGDLPTAYDCETTDGQSLAAVAGQAIEFHRYLATAHVPDTLYSGAAFMHTYLQDSRLPAQRWVASYGVGSPPAGAALWQYTDNRSIGGRSFDASVWTGSQAEFDVWCHVVPPTPAPAPSNPLPPPGKGSWGAVDGDWPPGWIIGLVNRPEKYITMWKGGPGKLAIQHLARTGYDRLIAQGYPQHQLLATVANATHLQHVPLVKGDVV